MSKFWRLSYVIALILVACTSPGYPGIDNRPIISTSEDQQIIAYIDSRLEKEYYWLEEVNEKSHLFNRNNQWENYLDTALAKLTTNLDDGYLSNKGNRVFYSYIHEVASVTRAEVAGFGIGLYYTIAIMGDSGYYGFIVESVYPGSAAFSAGIKRGDIITKINGSYIDQSNFYDLFQGIANNSIASLRLELVRQSDGESFIANLEKMSYHETPIIHKSVIEVDGHKIGYFVYDSFDSSYDEDMLAVFSDFAAQGVEDVILDLRYNGGGSVTSAVKLCSALMPATLEGTTLCAIRRNPNNKNAELQTLFTLENTGTILNLSRLTVICSSYTASASELVVMGLRGLDIPVRLIGSTTQGKNCGMDVTRKKIGNTTVEYAPITFMCFNAKGFGEWGEGIVADVDLTKEDNAMGVADKNYPMPRCDWGDINHDIGLAAAVADVTGKKIAPSATRATYSSTPLTPTQSIAKPIEGIRIYHQE